MIKSAFTILSNRSVYIISSVRRVWALFSMRKRSIDDEGEEPKLGDAARVLETLRALHALDETGATRAEIAEHLNEPAIDVVAALGVLQSAGLVNCEGTTGYPAQALWRLKEDG